MLRVSKFALSIASMKAKQCITSIPSSVLLAGFAKPFARRMLFGQSMKYLKKSRAISRKTRHFLQAGDVRGFVIRYELTAPEIIINGSSMSHGRD